VNLVGGNLKVPQNLRLSGLKTPRSVLGGVVQSVQCCYLYLCIQFGRNTVWVMMMISYLVHFDLLDSAEEKQLRGTILNIKL